MKLFIDHFLNFQQEFICLETIQLIDITYFTFYLLINVSSLLFINENINVLIQNFIKETLERQRNILTKLSLDDDNVFESINLPFYQLTYLTIDYCSSSILSHIVKNLIPSITHLDISIDQLDLDTKRTCPDLSCLSSSLTHLTLRIGSDNIISFDILERCLIKLEKLINLIIEAIGTIDVICGYCWE
ncbi:unnamed protein product [Rotaria sp. Silwood1]|nr:unnamed protein product [Rotaria sp. Silwood1]